MIQRAEKDEQELMFSALFMWICYCLQVTCKQ